MPEGPPRIYKGTFCTGHVPMVGTTSIQFSENTFHEYIEEYKNVTGMKVKTRAGLAHQFDFSLRISGRRQTFRFRVQARSPWHRKSPRASRGHVLTRLLVAGTTTPSLHVARCCQTRCCRPASAVSRPLRWGSASSQVGSYYHDPVLDERDQRWRRRGPRMASGVCCRSRATASSRSRTSTQHRLL